MELKMFIGNKLVDSINIEPGRVITSDYLIYVKQELIERNEDQIEASAENPEFVIDTVPSRMNLTTRFEDIINALDKSKKNLE